MSPIVQMANVSFRDAAKVKDGGEIAGRYSLASLLLLADTLGVDPTVIEIVGVVRSAPLHDER